MTARPPDPLVFHPLPAAPYFVGRQAELEELRAHWASGLGGVVALIGLGGSGKTAVAAQFLQALGNGEITPRPEGLFVWSFYQEPDAGLFLEEAYRYFCPDSAAAAKGAGLLHLLRESLSRSGQHLLVLDGLERVQRQETDAGDSHGQIEDPLLRGLLTRLAEGLGQTMALVTSRFPLTDLASFRAGSHRHIDVGGLDPAAARALLRARGVNGDDSVLNELIAKYGAHALTLEHLGGLIGQFLGGDARLAPEAPVLTNPGSDRQALRLARLLRAYEERLPPAELALLSKLSLVRRNLFEEQIVQLFLCSPPVSTRAAREAGEIFERFPGFADYFPGDEAAALGEAVTSAVETALCEAPIAGPEDGFRREMAVVVEAILEHRKGIDADAIAHVIRLYEGHQFESSSDQRPLSPGERTVLLEVYDEHCKLREHPLLPFSEPGMKPKAKLPSALQKELLIYGAQDLPYTKGDFTPADILKAFRRCQLRLHFLLAKHAALRRVRNLCRLLQQKWSLAGVLAPLDEGSLAAILNSLRDRHLIVHEANGSYSVHPALRDHFSHIDDAGQQGAWHDVLREQLISLVHRPGRRPPEDRAALDVIEEAIHHAQKAGQAEDGWRIYTNVLGGVKHLGWKLGEIARGLRILRSFEPCPDRWALAWYLRALGEFEHAFAENELAFFRSDIRLLQGRLAEVAALGDDGRSATARFLMGQTTSLPSATLGCAVPRVQLLLYLGRLARARDSVVLEGLYQQIGWEGERARCQLLVAEAARRQADIAAAERSVGEASPWILHSGSIEHLCLMHLVRARIDLDSGRVAEASRAADEGLHLARQCGLGLYHVELLCERSNCFMAEQNLVGAEKALREALERALDPGCLFLWGAAMAEERLGAVLLHRQRRQEARATLKRALALQRKIGDPRAEQTERLLCRLEPGTTGG